MMSKSNQLCCIRCIILIDTNKNLSVFLFREWRTEHVILTNSLWSLSYSGRYSLKVDTPCFVTRTLILNVTQQPLQGRTMNCHRHITLFQVTADAVILCYMFLKPVSQHFCSLPAPSTPETNNEAIKEPCSIPATGELRAGRQHGKGLAWENTDLDHVRPVPSGTFGHVPSSYVTYFRNGRKVAYHLSKNAFQTSMSASEKVVRAESSGSRGSWVRVQLFCQGFITEITGQSRWVRAPWYIKPLAGPTTHPSSKWARLQDYRRGFCVFR